MDVRTSTKRFSPPTALLILAAAFFMSCGAHSQSQSGERSESSVTSAQCQHEATAFHCVKFIKNYDADTITFDIPGVHPLIGKHVSVRVNGVDAPEIKGANECEKQSARIARNLVEHVLEQGKRIDLVNVERDKYFRILADVIVDGRSVRDILMKNGLAYEYHGKTKKKVDWCAVARGDARLPAGDEPGEARPVHKKNQKK